jgi:hypothetical protein
MTRSIQAGAAIPTAIVAPIIDYPGGHSVSGTNALLTITLAAPADIRRWTFDYVHWSYNVTPSEGILTITDGVGVTEIIYIASGGPGFLPFGNAFAGSAAVTITLSAGGTDVNSSLAVIGALQV